MNNLLSRLDKYKYGMFFMVAFFIVFSSIRVKYGFIERPDISHLLNKKADDVIELKLEPLELVEQRMNATGEVKNAAHNENSDGSSSSGSNNNSGNQSYYGPSKSLKDVEQSVYDLEKSMFEETGGATTRAEIQKGMEQRKKEQEEANKNKPASSSSSTQKSAGDSNKGRVLVRYNVANRTGQNVPAPGYMCPQGTSGEIVINIKVDQSGKVIEAKVNPSSPADECMAHHALIFAKKSRFNYSSGTSGTQEGTITYTFVN